MIQPFSRVVVALVATMTIAACSGGADGTATQAGSTPAAPSSSSAAPNSSAAAPTAPSSMAPAVNNATVAAAPAAPSSSAAAPARPAAVATIVDGIVNGKGSNSGRSSVTINGVSYDDSGATTQRDVNPMAATPATVADIKLGMHVQARVDATGMVIDITSIPAAGGQVSAFDPAAGTFQVAGQTVMTVATGANQTVFDGFASLADVKLSDLVEVHGMRETGGTLVATRVSRLPAGDRPDFWRASGVVSALNTTAKTFVLGAVTVDYSAATLVPAEAKLANDVEVYVFSDTFPTAGVLKAKSIRLVQPRMDEEGRNFAIAGLVNGFKSIAEFKVNGFSVDATGATIVGPTNSAADVKNDTLVQLEGTITGGQSRSEAPKIKATRITVLPAPKVPNPSMPGNPGVPPAPGTPAPGTPAPGTPAPGTPAPGTPAPGTPAPGTPADPATRVIVLAGQVEAFVSLANFKVMGSTVDASGAMVKFDKGAAADIKDGTFVAILGRAEGNVVKAEKVSVETPPKDMAFRLQGPVSNVNATARTFTLLGIPMVLADNVTYTGGVAADLVDGKVVEVDGMTNGAKQFRVTAVTFKKDAEVASRPIFVYGTATAVSATGLTVDGQAVVITADTKVLGGPLANGQFVNVVGRLVDGKLTAIEIAIRPAAQAGDGPKMVQLNGPVSDLAANAKTFRLLGALVDYSAATFANGDAAKLANGANVMVSGTTDGVTLKAKEVKFR